MEPIYTPNKFDLDFSILDTVPWVQVVQARKECFMSVTPREYTYGSGRGERTYTSSPMLDWVKEVMESLGGCHNVCFLNFYENERNALGWHADDSPGTNLDHPIEVISLGESREIWWRFKDRPSEVFKQLLEHGSSFVMPAGFQVLCDHRIPKASKKCNPRASLTFRQIVP